jgi:hypothetical protein
MTLGGYQDCRVGQEYSSEFSLVSRLNTPTDPGRVSRLESRAEEFSLV